MFVERNIAFFVVLLDFIFFECVDAGENEKLRLAAEAILALVVVQGAAGLTEHVVVAIRTP
jgi:hypothetical protein